MFIYHSFAAVYDQLFDPQMYERWADYSQSRVSIKRPVVLDLAGGAGRFATIMAARGWQMVDLDQSAEMLSLATEHADEQQFQVAAIQGDMTNLAGLGQFDAVTCYADSLNYLPEPAQVIATLRQVAGHLTADGVFLFDVITPYQTDVVYPGYMFNGETAGQEAALLWRSYADDDVEHGVIHDLVIFSREDNGAYQRQAETHFERAYPLDWWQQQLAAAGFTDVQVTADFGQSLPNPQTTRWFFECRQAKEPQ